MPPSTSSSFRLPVPGDACDTQDLARADLERDALQPLDPAAHHTQVVDLEGPQSFGLGRHLLDPQQHLAAHHHLGQLRGRGIGGLDRVGHLAGRITADGVGDLHDLAQLVGDQDDRLPLFRAAARGCRKS